MPPEDHPRQHPNVTLAILAIGALAFALAQTSLIPALPEIQHHFHATTAAATWLVTAYFLVASVATPILGRLGDMFGKRRLLAISLAAFAVGSVVSALGPNLAVTVAGRALQGIGGAVFPLSFGIVRDELPREKVATGIALLGAVAGIGGGIGLPLGGIITDHASFHWIFWIAVAMAVIATITTELYVPESPVRTPGRVDVRGAVVLAAGLTLPLLAISQAGSWGWGSARLLSLVAAGVAILAAWVQLERRTPEPLVNMTTLARWPVLTTDIATLLVGFGLFGSYILIPELAQIPKGAGHGFGLNATEAGLLLVPNALLNLLIAPVSGRISARSGAKVALVLGCVVSAFGLFLLAFAHGSILQIVLWAAVLGVGIGFAFAAMPNCIIEAVDPHETGEATGVNTIMRNVGASLGSQISASMVGAHLVAGTQIPSDDGFTIALTITAAGSLLGALCGLAIPRPGQRRREQPEPAAA